MLERIRFHASVAVMWVGANLAPYPLRPVLRNIIDAWAGIPDQQRQGRTGGIIMTGWSTNIAGRNLAEMQMQECGKTAFKVRKQMEDRSNPPGEIFPIPLERNDEAYIYSPKTKLPETTWRPADPAPDDTEDSLDTELCNWCGENRLDWTSADELLLWEDLTPEQRCYLHKFIERREAVLKRAEKEQSIG